MRQAAARAALCAALAGIGSGCATTASNGAASSGAQPLAAQLEPGQRERLHRLAPDFLARADRAAERAARAPSPEIASEHAACATLLLEAAKHEAERIELERRLVAEELRRDAALRALAAERYAILALDAQAALSRGRVEGKAPDSGSEAAPRTSSELTRRARLRLAAARALGAEPGPLAEAERQVRLAGDRPDQARAALELAERVLARARAGR